MSDQTKRPLYDALKEYAASRPHSFDVPGHKMGQGMHPDFVKDVGPSIFQMDFNSMPELDNLSNPETVIAEAEQLAAEFFQADHAFFLVNGSTSGIQNMILCAVKPGETILIPRNIHKSAINGLVLSGANPVYIYPEIEPSMGISVGHSIQAIKQSIQDHPEAKAILLLHPTYYGYESALQDIIELAHQHHLIVLVDESHGSHFYIDSRFGQPSIQLGADMATISMHKTGGSLTQSSILLLNEGRISKHKVRSTINVMQTSSASYLLLASLDMARHYLANYPDAKETLYQLSVYAQEQIQSIKGLYVPDKDTILNGESFHHDPSKLLIDIHDLGHSGYDIYLQLKREFNIQLEVGESRIILAIISLGDTKESIDALVSALQELSNRYYQSKPRELPYRKYIYSDIVKTPREAFFSDTEYIPISEANGRIAGDQIMIYPPGIPLLVPGEIITNEIIDEYLRLISQGNKVIGSLDNTEPQIKVVKE